MSHRSLPSADRSLPSANPLPLSPATTAFDVESVPEPEWPPTVNHKNPGDQLLHAIRQLVDRLTVSQSIDSVPRRLAYSLEETATLLGLEDVGTVRSLINRGLLKPSRGLRHLRVAHAEIERYLTATAF